MPFLTDADYAEIKSENLESLVSDTERLVIENRVISQVRTYLSDLYDVDTVFAQTGESRHPHLLQVCIDMVLYRAHKRQPKRAVPDHIATDYQDALDFLRAVSDGKIGMELPRKASGTIGGNDSISSKATRFRAGFTPRKPV